jgi:basic amino acid/polyamine antiporter, APA family
MNVTSSGSGSPRSIEIAEEEGAFARKASGLVRAWAPFDAWVFNVLAINVVVQAALLFVLIPVLYPGASVWLAALIAGAFCTAEALVYALLVSAMPRSGGDYVFQSRILGGAWATVFAFTLIALSAAIFMALAGWLGANLIFGPFLTVLGAIYGIGWMQDVGEFFLTPEGVFAMGVACTVWAAFVTIVGMRFYAMVQRWFFGVGAAALLILGVAVLFTDHQSFVNNFDSLMSTHFGIDNAYGSVLDKGGSADLSFSLSATILATVVASFSLIYPGWSAQTGGEIKRASNVKTNIKAIVGAEVFSFLIMAVIAGLLVSKVGNDFLYASGSLFYNTPDDYNLPAPPFFGLLLAIAPGGTFFIWLAFIMFLSWFWMWFPNIPLAGSRVLVAMSFDRVLPEWLGRVHPKTHTPVNAIVVYSIPMIGLAALYAFNDNFYKLTLGLAVQGLTAIAITMVAAALFPYLKPDFYKTTVVARYKLFGLPLTVPAAAVFVAFAVFCEYKFFTADELGINGSEGLIFVFGTYAIALAVYLIAKLYRRREGLDLGVVYRELPAE